MGIGSYKGRIEGKKGSGLTFTPEDAIAALGD